MKELNTEYFYTSNKETNENNKNNKKNKNNEDPWWYIIVNIFGFIIGIALVLYFIL
jgi:ATP-dependent Zn protease